MSNTSLIVSSKRKYLYLLIFILFPIALNFILFSFDLDISYGDGNVWLAFWGNYSGGVISAIVAYFVANSQINKQKQIDLRRFKYESATNQLPALVRIKIELEKSIAEMKRVKEYKKIVKEMAEGAIREEAEMVKDITVVEITSVEENYNIMFPEAEVFKYLEKVEEVKLHIELIEFFNFYKDFSYGISLDLREAKEERSKRTQIRYSDDETIENEKLIYKVNDYIDKTTEKKTALWNKFTEEKILDKSNKVLTDLNNEIDKVKSTLENGVE